MHIWGLLTGQGVDGIRGAKGEGDGYVWRSLGGDGKEQGARGQRGYDKGRVHRQLRVASLMNTSLDTSIGSIG